MDTSAENLDESMLDVIQRAEAFITAHSFLNRAAERSASNIFDASDDSFRTASDESSAANDSGLNTSAGPSTSGANNSAEEESAAQNGCPAADSGNIEVLSDDSQATVTYDLHDPSAEDHSPSEDNDDCVVIEDPHQVVVDLCSPYPVDIVSPRSRRARRRRADAAPVVESISLDDTVAESISPKKRLTTTVAANFIQPSSQPSQSAATPAVTCPICLESIFHQQAASTVCGHLFCNQCIRQEIQIRKKCPMCKRSLKRHQVHPIYFN